MFKPKTQVKMGDPKIEMPEGTLPGWKSRRPFDGIAPKQSQMGDTDKLAAMQRRRVGKNG